MTPLNLPLHPLFVHGAVVFIPLAALVAMAFVLRADWRWALRWPTLLINAAGFVALWTTRATGEQLMHATPDHKDLIEKHDQMAGLLTVASTPMMLLAFFAVWSFASTTPLASGKGAREARQPKFAAAVKWLIVVLGVATLVFTVLTGHTGATAAWAA